MAVQGLAVEILVLKRCQGLVIRVANRVGFEGIGLGISGPGTEPNSHILLKRPIKHGGANHETACQRFRRRSLLQTLPKPQKYVT